MRIRCPHCRNAIEIVGEESYDDLTCPACGSTVSLVGYRLTDTHRSQPKELGHFQLIEEVGTGAFGSVWLARDTELDREVAVKIPRREQLGLQEREQFLREARAAAQLRHPNIVSVHEVGRAGDTIYIVSAYPWKRVKRDNDLRQKCARLGPRIAVTVIRRLLGSLSRLTRQLPSPLNGSKPRARWPTCSLQCFTLP
jgi:hypothetical protein